MSKKEQTSTKWSIPVTRRLDEAVEEAVKKGNYAGKSDFVRDAVRRRLEEIGEARKLLDLLKEPEVYRGLLKLVKDHKE